MNQQRIPIKEFHFSFSRSSGAGGQNVNKVNSKVTLKWNIKKSRAYRDDLVERFLQKYSQLILEDGTVVITGQRFRSQGRNIADCIEKLYTMIESVSTVPKQRKATRPTKSSIENRLKVKKGNSEIKKARQKPEHY